MDETVPESGEVNETSAFNPYEELPYDARISHHELVSYFNGTYDGKMAVRIGFTEESTKKGYSGLAEPAIIRQIDVTQDYDGQRASFEASALVLGRAAGKKGKDAELWGRVEQGEFIPAKPETQERLNKIIMETQESYERYKVEQPKLGSVDFNAFYAKEHGVNAYRMMSAPLEGQPPIPLAKPQYLEEYFLLSLRRKNIPKF